MKVKKKLFIVISLIATSLIYCSKSSEILSEFKNGTVSRWELETYYDMNSLRNNQRALEIQTQSQILEEISISKIIDMENQKEKIVSEESLKKILDVLSWQILFRQFKENFEKNSKEKMKIADSIYMLYIADTKNKQSLADSYLKELNKKGVDFKKFIQKNTEEKERKSVLGRIEPVCLNCGSDPFTDIIKEASLNKKHNFVKINRNSGIYLVKVEKISEVDPKNLYDVYKKVISQMKKTANASIQADKNHFKVTKSKDYYASLDVDSFTNQISSHFKKMFFDYLWNQYVRTIIHKNNISFTNLQTLSLDAINDGTIFIRSKNGNILFSDVKKEYNVLRKLVEGNQTFNNENVKKQMILQYAQQSYFPIYVIKDIPDVLELKKTEKYKSMQKMMGYNVLQPIFLSDKFKNTVLVSEQELKDTYESGKNFVYSKPSPTDPSKKIPQKFEEVKESIRQDIIKNKKKTEIQNYISKLKQDYNLKIHMNKLKQGKI